MIRTGKQTCGRWLGACSLGLLILNGCGKPSAPNERGGAFAVSAVLARVQKATVNDQVSLVASLQSKDQVTVVSELDATIDEMAFEEGAPVREGDVLFRLDPVRTEAQLEEAEAAFRLADLSYQRNHELLTNSTISQQEYDQSEATYYERKAALALARDQHDKSTVTASLTGVAGERLVSVGQFVSRGQVLTSLVGMDPLELAFDVPERFLGRLSAGQPVTFRTAAFPDDTFHGHVSYLAPALDENSRTLRVKAEAANSDGRLKPGMFGKLDLVLGERTDALVVPESCVHFSADATSVMAVSDQGTAELRVVHLGQHLDDQVEVLDGLAEGELVVVEGAQKMGPGMPVIAAPESERYGVTPGPLAPPPASEVPDAAE